MNNNTSVYNFGDGIVPAHKHPNGGGWVADTATVDLSAYVGENALVYGRAKVYGNAWVCEDAEVYGRARVFGRAMVFGDAKVYKLGKVYGRARVSSGEHI